MTVAPVAAPLPSVSASGVLRAAPVALFQWLVANTPALSVAPIGVGPVPTKRMPIVPAALRCRREAVTVTATARPCGRALPLVPVTVMENVAAGAPAAIATVIVDVALPVTDAGLKETFAADG